MNLATKPATKINQNLRNVQMAGTSRGKQYSHCPPKREPRINRVL